MAVVSAGPRYETIEAVLREPVLTVRLHRPGAGNAITPTLVAECRDAVARYGPDATIVVLEGSPEVFCVGADFAHLAGAVRDGRTPASDPAPLYDLWLDLATGPYVSVAHVRGRVNAGGVGFVAACDIALADDTATFGLSELLFGLMPACVLPFLARRVGVQRAHYLALMTQPVSAAEALRYGLVDACDPRSADLLRRHLLRLRRLSKPAVARWKRYLAEQHTDLADARGPALGANRAVFTDRANLDAIARFVATGAFPWEQDHDSVQRR
jgi:polyketide biosynthesis enoyl-CoA hydratase PksH